MATGDQRAASDVLKAIARHLNCLNEGSKNTKKRALESIKRETIDKGLSSDVLQEVFTSLLKSLLKCLSDPMERCRETAIQMIGDFIRCVPKPEDSLPYLMPTLAHRLGGKDIVEPAEELRLAMMEVLSLTVEVCGRQLTPYLDDVFKILQRTIIDPFPDVKRESCKCTVDFAKSTPEHFHMQAESLVKPLMLTISHQHSRVRVGAIEATGAVIQHGTGKNVDDVLSHLAQRLFDDSPQVRKAVTVVVGGWLLHLRDRYSYFHKLLPLLLSSFSDEIPEIRALSTDLWKQVGSQWERENEEDLKDKLDFLLSPPALYPAGVERPGLGCRELVVRNLSKLVPALSRDLTDWLPATRLKTARLLSVLLLHAEDHCTQHLQPLLATLYRACADAEPLVAPHCLDSAKLLGTFVSPEVFLKLLLAHVENSSSSSSSSPWTPLMVLAAALRGSSGPLLRPHLARVADTLAHPDVCQGSQQVVYLEQLVACVDALLEVCAADCGTVSLPLLKVLVTVESLSAQPELQDKVEGCVTRLGGVQSVPGQVELFRQHMAELLRWLADGLPSWSRYSVQSSQLGVVLTRAGPVVGEFLPELMSVLQGCVQASREPELRLHILTMLARLLLNAAHTLNSQGRFGEYVQVFLAELLLPNLVWHAGRTSAALRTAALTCLLTLLQGGGVSPAQVLSVEANLTPQLLSALEEDSRLARRLACTSICSLLTLTAQQLHPDTLNKIYPELLKRVDDSSEEVRVEALGALGQWFSSLGPDYEPQACSPHLQLLFQQLLLYLDDPDGSLQDTVLEVLRTGSAVHPGLLQQEVEAVRDKQRNPASCDQLLQHIASLCQS